jgi:hypothetical protein
MLEGSLIRRGRGRSEKDPRGAGFRRGGSIRHTFSEIKRWQRTSQRIAFDVSAVRITGEPNRGNTRDVRLTDCD